MKEWKFLGITIELRTEEESRREDQRKAHEREMFALAKESRVRVDDIIKRYMERRISRGMRDELIKAEAAKPGACVRYHETWAGREADQEFRKAHPWCTLAVFSHEAGRAEYLEAEARILPSVHYAPWQQWAIRCVEFFRAPLTRIEFPPEGGVEYHGKGLCMRATSWHWWV